MELEAAAGITIKQPAPSPWKSSTPLQGARFHIFFSDRLKQRHRKEDGV
jgi:hypothetical protein